MTVTSVRAKMLEDLARSGLDEGDVKKLLLKEYTKEGSYGLQLSHAAEGYVIPYFDVKGNVTKFFRYRFLEDVRSGFQKLSGAKSLKYAQQKGTLNEVYLAPFMDWEQLLKSDDFIVITEGEKKAAAATKAGVPTIGLGGVWNFQSSKAGLSLLKDLTQFSWKDRKVYVVFDSDAAANVDVRMAAQRLANRLSEQGASVFVGYLPDESGKVGLDDFLLTHTEDEFQAWLEELPLVDGCKALHDMNNLVTYVVDPGLIYVNKSGQHISPRAFKEHAFSHYSYTERVETKTAIRMRKVKTAAEWLDWAHRASVKKLVYEPGAPRLVEGQMNLWLGYPVEPVKGSIAPWTKLFDFLFTGFPEERRWFEQWCAYPFQYPGTKLRTAVLIWGHARGTGKSLIGFTLGEIYGQNYVFIKDNDLENQNFNDWAANKQFVFADEVTGHDNRKLANKLKSMITSEQVRVNVKYVPQFTIRDCLNYYFTSNDPDAFYLDAGERRYFIHEVKHKTPLPLEFYEKVYDPWRRSKEGQSALLYHMLSLDVTGFSPVAAAPHTAAKQEMVSMTRTELETYVQDIANNPDDFLKIFGGGDLTTIQEIVAKADNGDGRHVSTILMARKLKGVGLEHINPRGYMTNQVRLSNGGRVIFYALKNVDKWRGAKGEELKAHYEKFRHFKGKK